jgi:hypothetical protein
MAIDVKKMDKVSGLSADKFAAMDRIASGGAPKKAGDKSGDWTDMLPGIFGTGGQILGGIGGTLLGGAGGTAVEPGGGTVLGGIGGERLGQTAGGAAGQGAGEAIRQFIKGKGYDPGAITSETAQGGLYGALPGSQLFKGIANPVARTLARGAGNFAAGSAVGGATQGVRNIQEGKPLGENVGESAITTGSINAALPMVGSAISKPSQAIANILLDKIPASVRKQLDSLHAQMKQLENDKMGHTVGFANIPRAKDLGYHHNMTAEEIRDKLESELQGTGNNLNETLGHETVGTNLANLKTALLKARDQAFSGSTKNKEKLDEFVENMDKFLKAQVMKAAHENPDMFRTPESVTGKYGYSRKAASGTAADKAAQSAEALAPQEFLNKILFEKRIPLRGSIPVKGMVNGKTVEIKPGESPENFLKRLEQGSKKLATYKPPKPSKLVPPEEIAAFNNFSAGPATGPFNAEQHIDFANDQSPISLLLANKVKTELGKLAYAKNGDIVDPTFAAAYSNLQHHIEESSGNPEQIKGLNLEYQQLRDMLNHTESEISKPKMTPAEFTAKKLALENKSPKNQSLEAMAAAMPILLGFSMGGIPGAGVGLGGFAAYRLLSTLLGNQGAQKALVKAAENIKNSKGVKATKAITSPTSQNPLKKNVQIQNPIQRAIQQGGVQGAGAMSDN